jgi:hypothetical protein
MPAPQPMRMQEELVLEDLLSLAEELEGRLAEIRARERLQAEQAASLLAAQAELAQKLQTAVEQLDANADVPVRASA